EHGEAKRRSTFLETLEDPEGTLVEATAQALEYWPPGGQILEEVLAFLQALPSDRRRKVVAETVEELGGPAAWLLRAVLHLPDPALQRLALHELVRLRDPAAGGAIARLKATAGHSEIRDEAAAARQRRLVHPVDRDEPVEPLPFPPLDRAFISMVDGAGGQVILVMRDLGAGASLL